MPTRALFAPTLLFDAAYLTGFLFVSTWPWISYALLVGIAVGIAAALRWLGLPLQNFWQAMMLAGSVIMPSTAWLAAWRAEPVVTPAGMQDAGRAVEPAPSREQGEWSARKRVALGVMLGMVLVACSSGFLEQRVVGPAVAPAEQVAEGTLKRSLLLASASYASARLIDRGVALVSEAEISLPFVGGVSVKPGQVFKPLQDMAERYSDVMVMAMASIGIQSVLMELGQVIGATLLGSLAVAVLLVALIVPSAWSLRLFMVARAALVLLIMVRVAVPLAILGVSAISDAVLEERRQSAQQELNLATAELQAADVATEGDDEAGLIAWLRDMQDQTADMALSVRQFSDGMVERFIQLLVVYVLETLLLPLLMLFVLWRVTRTCLMPATQAVRFETAASRGLRQA
ncbi:hypothetical protein GCM10027040_32660 [Halomonas shantousis]